MFRLQVTVPLSLLLFLASATASLGIDPDRAEGTVTSGGTDIRMTHACALLHDNAEGVLSRKTELRIVVCDREIPTSALQGLAFLPVDERRSSTSPK